MATLPSARTRVSDTAGAVARGLDVLCVFSPVALNGDMVPRMFGTANAVYAQHGFSRGLQYASLHFERTQKSILFVGLPIVTLGAISRQDTSGKSGTCVTTVSAGGSGVLAEHDGVLTVVKGGVIGTDQIVIGLSLDGGRKTKNVRLSTANSYVVPLFGVAVAFGAGTLVDGETIHTWHGSEPRSDSASWATARGKLAAQQKAFRSILNIGDMQNHTEASDFLTQLNAYETANDRFIEGRVSVLDRLPQAAMTRDQVRMTGSPSLTFAEVGATGDTITRSAGSWITDGFVVGDTISVTLSALNNVTGPIASLTATVITLGTTDLAAEGPVAGCAVTGTPTITFAEVGATGDTIARSRGSWLTDGFRVGDLITIFGTVSNDQTSSAGIASLTATVITLGTTDLAAEAIGAFGISIVSGQTKAAWAAALDAEFASVDAAPRIDLSMGRGRVTCPFTDWFMRQSVAWAASLREYQHDLHIPVWRKDDGPTGFDLFNADGSLAEWDDRVDGGAASAARFTSFRTWANGPEGAFIALSLTRATENSLLSRTHNAAVVNLVQTIVQAAGEKAIGRSFVLNDDGTASTSDLSTLQTQVNSALELAVLVNAQGEGQRASKALYTPAADDILNVPEALLNGVVDLNLNGTIHKVNTVIRLRSGGQ